MPLPFPHKAVLNLGVGRDGLVGYGVESQSFVATVAEVNAGATLVLPKIPGFRYHIIDFLLIFAGAAAGATDIRLSSSASTPVDIMTVVVANAGNGVKLPASAANAVLGAGFNAELASGDGVLIRKTGGTLTGTTTVTGIIRYRLMR